MRSHSVFGDLGRSLNRLERLGNRHSAYGRMLLARTDSTDAPERKSQSWKTRRKSSKSVENAG